MDEMVYSNFSKWLDTALSQKMSDDIVAFNFNLYEGEGTFSVQLIGSTTTPDIDVDWACDNTFTTGENIFILNRKITGENWEEGLAYVIKIVNMYLEKGKNNLILKNKKIVGVGFVDGDVEIVYEKK